jgi:hypothetical protein
VTPFPFFPNRHTVPVTSPTTFLVLWTALLLLLLLSPASPQTVMPNVLLCRSGCYLTWVYLVFRSRSLVQIMLLVLEKDGRIWFWFRGNACQALELFVGKLTVLNCIRHPYVKCDWIIYQDGGRRVFLFRFGVGGIEKKERDSYTQWTWRNDQFYISSR